MYANITSVLRRNLPPGTRHLKPSANFWRSQKTQAADLDSDEIFRDSAKGPKAEIEDGRVRPFEDIPGPKKSLKSIVEFYVKTEGLTKAYKQNQRFFAKYGAIYKDNMLGQTFVHTMDPNDFEKVFRAEGKYPRRPLVEVWKEHRKRRNYFPGLLLLDGKDWHRIRQTIAPKMMRPKIVEENIDNFNAVAKDAIARFVKLKEAGGADADHIPDLEGELSRFSTESIGTVAFDARIGLYEDPPVQEALQFIDAVQNFFTLTQKLSFSIPSNMIRPYMDTPALKKFFKYADAIIDIGQVFVDRKMRELKQMAEKGNDPSVDTGEVSLLTYLLTKEELSPEEVNGQAVEVIFAGVDSTSSSLLWLLYHLARHPHVQDKLYSEIENVLGKDGEVTAQRLARLSYVKACLKESMRLTPVAVNNARILDQDIVLSGYNVPAQTFILLHTYFAATSEKYFKDPLAFKPERWLRENKGETHAFSNLPFGFGTRMCLGRRVAELEIYLFVCNLLQRFRLEYHHEPLEMLQKFVTVPDKPVKIKFVDRL